MNKISGLFLGSILIVSSTAWAQGTSNLSSLVGDATGFAKIKAETPTQSLPVSTASPLAAALADVTSSAAAAIKTATTTDTAKATVKLGQPSSVSTSGLSISSALQGALNSANAIKSGGDAVAGASGREEKTVTMFGLPTRELTADATKDSLK